jgi:hypothetical protein
MGNWAMRVPWAVIAAVIAILLGAVLLLLSYHVLPAEEYPFLHDFTHEVGFALLVAVVIFFAFQVFSEAETDERWIARIESMSRNVFLGVFKRNLPKEYIEEALRLVVEHTFVRLSVNFTYTLADAQYKNRSGQDENFVLFHSVARYKMKNITESSQVMPIRLALPNPLIDELKPFCKVNRVTVVQAAIERDLDITAESAAFAERLRNDAETQIWFKAGELTIQSEESVEVILNYTMAKEEEDTEIFTTRTPTEKVNITILDRAPEKRVVQALSIHRAGLRNNTPAGADGTYNYSLDHYLLPLQGFSVWWKRRPPVPQLSHQPRIDGPTTTAQDGLP